MTRTSGFWCAVFRDGWVVESETAIANSGKPCLVARTQGTAGKVEVEQANAHLMAAAPDLLDALEALKRGPCWCATAWASGEHDAACFRVRAALTKAGVL